MKKTFVFVLTVLTLMSAGCGKDGNLNDGKCPVEVRLDMLPQSFSTLDEDIRSQMKINFTLENMVSGKTYEFELTEKNDFTQDASLNPGTYRTLSCNMSGASAVNMEIDAGNDTFDIRLDQQNDIVLSVTNEAEFNQWVAQMWAASEVLKADRFSRKIQFKGQIIDIGDIADYVETEYDESVRDDKKAEIYDSDAGVTVTVFNDTGEKADWDECRVIAVSFTADNVIFGGGVRVMMPARELLHSEKGLYGTPESLEGCALIGADYDSFSAVYIDPVSGDRMTVGIDGKAERVTGITYELEAVELEDDE